MIGPGRPGIVGPSWDGAWGVECVTSSAQCLHRATGWDRAPWPVAQTWVLEATLTSAGAIKYLGAVGSSVASRFVCYALAGNPAAIYLWEYAGGGAGGGLLGSVAIGARFRVVATRSAAGAWAGWLGGVPAGPLAANASQIGLGATYLRLACSFLSPFFYLDGTFYGAALFDRELPALVSASAWEDLPQWPGFVWGVNLGDHRDSTAAGGVVYDWGPYGQHLTPSNLVAADRVYTPAP